jgi:hypothetical protein
VCWWCCALLATFVGVIAVLALVLWLDTRFGGAGE